ncbi:uncharacterized protein [Leuresthes tenuis]|uniref:uncharacterized protein n=1 Tax=Leuresthes tenuis TaxID=355514 RepID=UPI003B50799A
MVVKVVFFLGLVGFTSSKLLHIRQCDPVEQKQIPTLCSNYRNIEHVYGKLSKRFDSLEKHSKSNAIVIDKLRNNLTDAVAKLTKSTEKQQGDISKLKRAVGKLIRHRERVTGNFSEIEERLDLTEDQLKRKKAKLENLETETEAAFNDTKRLLSLYNTELSLLNMTAQNLGFTVEAQLNVTRRDLEDELKKIQKNSEAFGASLRKQKLDAGELKDETDRRLEDVNEQLKAQQLTVNQLMNKTKGLAKSLGSIEKGGKAEAKSCKLIITMFAFLNLVTKKVAFSASIVTSANVFTGPRTAGTSSVLIFDKVFTNVGSAYNRKTGIFTAPVKGVYQFTFMTFSFTSIYSSGALLLKNGCVQVSTWECSGSDRSDTTSNTVILELNVKDNVKIILWEGGKIHTSVFSGFLIFPLT